MHTNNNPVCLEPGVTKLPAPNVPLKLSLYFPWSLAGLSHRTSKPGLSITLLAWPSSMSFHPLPKFSILGARHISTIHFIGSPPVPKLQFAQWSQELPRTSLRFLKSLAELPHLSLLVKSGGHATDQGFSSTPGVQIALSRLNTVIYHNDSSTATIGAGLNWGQVYAALQPYGVTVPGGRTATVGVGGFTLGGGMYILIVFAIGYSWVTNRHGLAIDNVVAYELVLPDGEIMTVTGISNPDLSFALKGGSNNFGIVTKFVFKAYPIGLVWGGVMTFTGAHIPPLIPAVADFAVNSTDVNANIIAAYTSASGSAPEFSILAFYNGSTPPPGIFDKFLAIPRTSEDLKTRTYADLIATISMIYSNSAHLRGLQHTVSLERASTNVVSQVINQTDFYAGPGSFTNGSLFAVSIEPFLHSGVVSLSAGDSAYPLNHFISPLVLFWGWPDESSDSIAKQNVQRAGAEIAATAINEGQQLADLVLYNNYALASTPLERLYSVNLPRLRRIKKKYDPNNIMDLTGGFRF